MRLSMNQVTTYRWSFDEDLHAYRDAGYSAVGVWKRKLVDFGVDKGAELIADCGLEVSSLSWAGGFTGDDATTTNDNLDEARRTLDMAEAINAACVVLHPGCRNRHTRRHASRLLHSALDALLPHAAVAGVPIVLEPMHPACVGGWTFLTDPRETAALVAGYDSRWLRVAYDVYHAASCESAAAELDEIADLVGLVQIGDFAAAHTADADRCPLGEGRAPIRDVVTRLAAAGYEGALEVELRGPAIEPADYPRVLQQSKAYLSRACADAGQATRQASVSLADATAGG